MERLDFFFSFFKKVGNGFFLSVRTNAPSTNHDPWQIKQLTRSRLGDQLSGVTREAARPEKTGGSARFSRGLGL